MTGKQLPKLLRQYDISQKEPADRISVLLTLLVQKRITLDDFNKEWKRHLPSAEHRGHIRRFLRSDLTDEEDVASRGYVIWKRLNFALMEAAAAEKRRTSRRSK